ncbi:carbohydrate sulfotransferase 14-like [Diadema antillarum]|uniref:carbohydrate sulfotransferase 14-like n=1 Tax=Diadema antillarum TaxID=105358 RepID=UPI003A88D56B
MTALPMALLNSTIMLSLEGNMLAGEYLTIDRQNAHFRLNYCFVAIFNQIRVHLQMLIMSTHAILSMTFFNQVKVSRTDFAVKCSLRIGLPEPIKKEIKMRKLQEINMASLRGDIMQSDLLLSPSTDVDTLLTQYETVLRSLLDKHAPLVTHTIRCRPNSPCVDQFPSMLSQVFLDEDSCTKKSGLGVEHCSVGVVSVELDNEWFGSFNSNNHVVVRFGVPDGMNGESDEQTERENSSDAMSPSDSILDRQYRRITHLRETCTRLGYTNTTFETNSLNKQSLSRMDHIFVLDELKTLFCYVPKVGCTGWKRLFLLLRGVINSTESISHNNVHLLAEKQLLTLRRLDVEGAKKRLRNYTTFLFVREPFARILSAYRDKFQFPAVENLPMKKKFASLISRSKRKPFQQNKKILSNSDTVTFSDFVDYVGNSRNTLGLPEEEHWREMFRLCAPCDIRYDFIGHFETLQEDFRMILDRLSVKEDIRFPASSNPTNSSGSSVLDQYYGQLSTEQLESLYGRLSTDIELFDYPIPASIKMRVNASSA